MTSNSSTPVTATVIKPSTISIDQLKAMRRNTNLLAFGLALLGSISSYAALSGTKYPLQNFCYMPDHVEADDASNLEDMDDFKLQAIVRRSQRFERKSRRSRTRLQQAKRLRTVLAEKTDLSQFCENGKSIYTTHPSYLLSSDQPLAKSEFSLGSDRYKLPAKNRLDLDIRQPSNPGYLIYGIGSCLLTLTAYFLYTHSYKKYVEMFPDIFEQHRTYTLETQLAQTEIRENSILETTQNLAIQNHAMEAKTNYVTNQITREYEKYTAMDYSPGEIEAIQEQALKQEELQDTAFKLQIAELAKQISEAQLVTVKNEKEIGKIQGQIATPLLTPTDAKNQRIEQLKQFLKDYEDGWLMKLIEFRKPLWIIGGQGAGKSTLASCVILLRYFMLDCPLELIIDAHAQVNRLESWEPLVDVFGEGLEIVGDHNNYEQIAKWFSAIIQNWADRMPKFKKGEVGKVQMLVDEFSNLADVNICQEQAGRFSKHSLSDPRKAGYYVICLSHFDTLTGTGNKGGTSKARNTQTIKVERKSANGETPLPNVVVNGLPNETGDLIEFNATIPDWFRPEKILKFVNDGVGLFEMENS